MKIKFLYHPVLVIMLSAAVLSCSTDSSDNNNNNNNNAAEIQQISDNVESGSWRITSYIDSGQDETHHFTGYNFTFNSNGTITATNNGTTVNGTWSVTDSSNSSDDSSSDDDIDFNMMFQVSVDHDFDDLNDDWDIVSYSSSQISLIDISGGNGGTDTLIFQKN